MPTITLQPNEIEEVAQAIVGGTPIVVNGQTVNSPSELDDQSANAVRVRVGELNAAKAQAAVGDASLIAAKNDGAPTESQDEDDLLPGGVDTPSGYRHVATITANHEDGSQSVHQEDLCELIEIKNIDGVSVVVEKPSQESRVGVLRGRLIMDHGGRAYVFRRDFPEENTTRYLVTFSTQVKTEGGV